MLKRTISLSTHNIIMLWFEYFILIMNLYLEDSYKHGIL